MLHRIFLRVAWFRFVYSCEKSLQTPSENALKIHEFLSWAWNTRILRPLVSASYSEAPAVCKFSGLYLLSKIFPKLFCFSSFWPLKGILFPSKRWSFACSKASYCKTGGLLWPSKSLPFAKLVTKSGISACIFSKFHSRLKNPREPFLVIYFDKFTFFNGCVFPYGVFLFLSLVVLFLN